MRPDRRELAVGGQGGRRAGNEPGSTTPAGRPPQEVGALGTAPWGDARRVEPPPARLADAPPRVPGREGGPPGHRLRLRPRLLRPPPQRQARRRPAHEPGPDRLRPPRLLRHVRRDRATSARAPTRSASSWATAATSPRAATSPSRCTTYGYPKLLLQLRLEYADGSVRGRRQRRRLAADHRRPDPGRQRIRRRGVRRPPRDAGLVAAPASTTPRWQTRRRSSSPPAGRSKPR